MKKIFIALFLIITTTAFAADPPPLKTGWGPGVASSFGAFYLDGNYKLFQGGIMAGAVYTWRDSLSDNMSSVGMYFGPVVAEENGVTTTLLNAMVNIDLFKLSPGGSAGAGIGTAFWQSGKGIRAPTSHNTFLALSYKF